MDFGKAFSYVFEDPDWLKKVAIAALVGLIPVIGQFVLIGWTLEVTRRIIRQEPERLPELDFSAQLALGFKSFVIGLVYSIPILLLYVPIIIASMAMGDGTTSDPTNTIVGGVVLCCGGLMILYGLALMVLLPAAHGNFLATDRLGAAFDLKKVFGLLRAAPGAYLFVLLGSLISGAIAPLGGIACGVGAMLTSAYALLIVAHLYGQAYRQAALNKTF